MDQPALAVTLGLTTQVPDVHVERIRGRQEVDSPDLFVDRVAVHHHTWRTQKQNEQVELGFGQIQITPRPRRRTCGRVDDEVRKT